MDDEEAHRPRAGGDRAWQNRPEYLRERIDNLERQIKETRVVTEAARRDVVQEYDRRIREMAAEYDRRIRDTAESQARAVKDVEDNNDKRISKIETFLLTGLGLVATLFVGALFTLVSGVGPGGSG